MNVTVATIKNTNTERSNGFIRGNMRYGYPCASLVMMFAALTSAYIVRQVSRELAGIQAPRPILHQYGGYSAE